MMVSLGEDEREWLTQTVDNAYRFGQNEAGAWGVGEIPDAWHTYAEANPPMQDNQIQTDLKIKRGGGYTMVPVEWIWNGWLALGKFHVFGGMKGTGKSTTAFSLLAQITVGGRWPDGTPAPLGDVLIWSGEDDIADTILPRIVAAGGNPDRVCFIDGIIVDGVRRHFDPATDIPALAEAVRSLPELKAILIDPIVSASGADSHKNAETRRGLQPLVDLAIERRIALIGITHFTKNTQGKEPIERITGTLAYGAMPRVVWGAVKDEDEDAPRKLVRIASNIGKMGGGFEFLLRQEMIPQGFEAQRVIWGNRLTGSAMELLGGSGEPGEGMKAIEFLEKMLTEAGNAGVSVKDLKGAAEAHSLAWRTVERAKAKRGGIIAKKNSGARAGEGWYWVMDTAT
jgi:hypothetical protein